MDSTRAIACDPIQVILSPVRQDRTKGPFDPQVSRFGKIGLTLCTGLKKGWALPTLRLITEPVASRLACQISAYVGLTATQMVKCLTF
jgi:hypothetical protein